jgi:hypothetical protein
MQQADPVTAVPAIQPQTAQSPYLMSCFVTLTTILKISLDSNIFDALYTLSHNVYYIFSQLNIYQNLIISFKVQQEHNVYIK